MNQLTQLLLKIDAQKLILDELRKSMDNTTIREALQLEFLYESNRIEGNTLTLRETQLVIQQGITIRGKSMRDHLEAINHKEAILFIEDIVDNKILFSESLVKQIHALVLHGIDRDNAGRYRQVPVMIAGSSYLPPQPYLLPKLMEDYFLFYETQKNKLHTVVLAAEMHERLATIHPFIDGNGRIARLVMNLILLQKGFPLAIIGGEYEQRMAYYDVLEKAHTDSEKTDFILFIAQIVLDNMNRYIKILKGA